MSAPEFSRPIALDTLGEAGRRVDVETDGDERAALARRFGLVAIDRLAAWATLRREGNAVLAAGRIVAAVTQSCVASGAPVAQAIDEPFEIAFRPQPGEAWGEEEVELGEGDLDTIFYEGGAIDLGEAAAQTLALALDPYPRAPEAEAALKAAGVKSEAEAGPFGALAGLRDKLGSKGPSRE